MSLATISFLHSEENCITMGLEALWASEQRYGAPLYVTLMGTDFWFSFQGEPTHAEISELDSGDFGS